MISPEQAHHGINIGFHILILFTFLTILFFTFISYKERDSITKELNKAISKNIPVVMDNIDKINQKIGNKFDWGPVKDMVNKIEERYGNIPDTTIDHDKKLIKRAVIICCFLFFIIICAIVYFVVYKKMDIGLGTILLENFFIFVFIGIIEVLFFLNVALKYSPITTSDMMNQIIDRSEYHINEQLELYN
jgi:hypothetical protein